MRTLSLVCAACGWTPASLEAAPYPFRCPRAGTDDGDHVVRPVDPTRAPGAGQAPILPLAIAEQASASNPFIRYRTSLYSWHVSQSRPARAGLENGSATSAHDAVGPTCDLDADRDYCSLVERIDAAVERIAGTGFRLTPCVRGDALSQALRFGAAGGVWIKDETRNVSGSHKARHMMGVALYLEVLRCLGIDDGTRPLAVASCGNAALGAAVVARAIGRRLLVFVPDHAAATLIARLEALGATVRCCSRDSGHRALDSGLHAAGDPCYLAFRRAVEDGALPFSCQGSENGLVIEGGATIGYEVVDQIGAQTANLQSVTPRSPIPDPDAVMAGDDRSSVASVDRLFIQVGGGALASACVKALAECAETGRLAAMPRIHAIQTRGGHPLKRAYDRLVEHLLDRLPRTSRETSNGFSSDGDRAAYLLRSASLDLLDDSFRYARAHRSAFMWPWESEPQSVASGILDDETYDWAAVVEGMVRTRGFPIVVDEATLREANDLARQSTGIDVDHTGSSGLAGLMALTRSIDRPLPTERVVVVFTGVRRDQSDGDG